MMNIIILDNGEGHITIEDPWIDVLVKEAIIYACPDCDGYHITADIGVVDVLGVLAVKA